MQKKARLAVAVPLVPSGPPVYGQGGFYNAFGAKQLFEYAMTFCCPIDLLLWCRVCRLAKQAAEHHWEHGMIEQLVQEFCRRTGKPREYLDAVRNAGGFFTGPHLTTMVAGLRILRAASTDYDHAHDFLLPAAELGADERTPSGMFKRRATIIDPKMLDSNISEMFVMADMRVTQVQRLSVGMMQTHTHNSMSVPLYECIRITDLTVFWLRYLGVSISPIRFAATCNPLPFERCLFDGKRLLIHDVSSILERKGLYRKRNYAIYFHSFRKHLESVPAFVKQVWARWGFEVELPRQVKEDEHKSPTDPMALRLYTEANGSPAAVLDHTDEEVAPPVVAIDDEEEAERFYDPIFDARCKHKSRPRNRTYAPPVQRWR